MNPAKILVIDDESHLRELYGLTLSSEGYEVEEAGSVEEGLRKLRSTFFACVLVDMSLPDGDGLQVLKWLHDNHRPESSIVITAHGSADNAVKALKEGAFDYMSKPVEIKALRQAVATAIGLKQQGAEVVHTLDQMEGVSAAILAVKDAIRRVGPTMAPVFILGPTGSGKELVARAIHELSGRSGKFIAVNCGAIPEALIEAEFFGYRKGAFTGAMRDHDGFFQAANHGTLFLDEVADLPLSMQSKLLRTLQERRVRAIGETQEKPVDTRVVSATWQDVDQLVKEGKFRSDLFFRLDVIRLTLPALSQRREDIVTIARALLQKIANEAGYPPLQLTQEAEQALSKMPLPGNVRELDNILQRAAALRSSSTIEVDELLQPTELGSAAEPALPDSGQLSTVPTTAPELADSTDDDLPDDLEQYLAVIEKRVLLRALEKTGFNRSAAAERLGITLRQIRYRMERLGIDEPSDE